MKKLLILFLLSVTASFAQSTVTIPKEGTLASEQWVKEFVDQKLKDRDSFARIASTGIVECIGGPVIETVYRVSPASATVRFRGVEVYGITFIILNDGEVLRTGAIIPKNDTPVIQFDPLPPGDYTLSFYGNTCYGFSQATFTIPKK